MDSSTSVDRAVLPFESRCRSRLLVTLESGAEVALVLERGRILRGGERVTLGDGRTIEIVAADEALLEARSDDPLIIARAAYHLGNRHVALQVLTDRLRLLDDHVLSPMLVGLGLQVTRAMGPFEPEGGAYGHHHAHGSEKPIFRPKIHDFSP